MMLTHCPGSRPIPTRPEATRATSSPKLRAVTVDQECPSPVLRSMIVEPGARAIRSASSHGIVQVGSGSLASGLAETPSTTEGEPATGAVACGMGEEVRGVTGSF